MENIISFVMKPASKLKHEIKPFEPDAEYKKDFHKSMRMVVIECEKVGKLYTERSTGFHNFKMHLN